jgi:tetratricopeptide (TPR) repeat protein
MAAPRAFCSWDGCLRGAQMASVALPTNPYIAGRAVGQGRGFCGREDILRLIETRLRSPEQSAVVLYGQRRIGKTSILLQLQRRLPSPPFVPVYFDLMDRARQQLGQVLSDIAGALAEAAGLPPPDAARFDDRGRFFRREFLPALYAALGPARNPVLLLDEFDVLDMALSERISEAAAAHTFFPYLRQLLEGEPRLKFVFVVGRRVEDLSIIVKSLFKTTTSQRVSVLEGDTARELVRTAHRQGTLGMAQPVVDRILALTAGHPYLTQLVCQILWDTAYAANPKGPPSIQRVEQVEAAAERALEAGQNIFEWIWDGLPPAERVIFAAIAGATDERSVIGEEQLTQLLQSQGVRILTRDLELAPRTLVEWEMLREADGGYRFFIELMRRWVAARKPLPRVRDELDRIVPLADNLYRSADAFYRQGDTENALSQLRQALRVNENHLKARLLLGQVLLERKDAGEAVKELEEAYKYDDAAARYPLLRALLVLAEAHERAGADDDALACYERVLALSPQDRVAAERRVALLARRAAAARASGRLADAQQIYEQAGDKQRASVIAAERAQQERERLASEARGFEAGGEWDKAMGAYQRLTDLEPGDPQWRAAFVRAQVERALLQRYTQGAQALGQGNRPEAVGALSEVVRANPSYRDAARLLVQAQEQLTTELRRREGREDWKGAIALCDEMLARQPNDEHWVRERARLAEEERLGERYAAGITALGERKWMTAVAELAEVLAIRPGYKDAARQLQRAQRGPSNIVISAARRWAWPGALVLSGAVALLLGWLLGEPLVQWFDAEILFRLICCGITITACVAVGQWLLLRGKLPNAGWWVPASALPWTAVFLTRAGPLHDGLPYFYVHVDYGPGTLYLARSSAATAVVAALIFVVVVTVLQCAVLWSAGLRRSALWLIVSPPAWFAGVAFSAVYFGFDSHEEYYELVRSNISLSVWTIGLFVGLGQALVLRQSVRWWAWLIVTPVSSMIGLQVVYFALAPVLDMDLALLATLIITATAWALLALLCAPLVRRFTQVSKRI